jgi:hypothetical protein
MHTRTLPARWVDDAACFDARSIGHLTLLAAWTFLLSFDATRYSHANRPMLARFHPWSLGYLVASMLAPISWLQHWLFGCSAARLDTFAGCAAARSILGRLWTIALCIWLLLPNQSSRFRPSQRCRSSSPLGPSLLNFAKPVAASLLLFPQLSSPTGSPPLFANTILLLDSVLPPISSATTQLSAQLSEFPFASPARFS